MIPTSGYRVITNRTTGKELKRVKTNWEIVLSEVGSVKLVVDHGVLDLKLKRSGDIWTTLEAQNGRVLCEMLCGYFYAGESMTLTPS
jgi:hypothetical protein